MSGFPILDLVVGMIFIYFMLSIISSSAVEMVLSVRKIRAKMLEKWLLKIFDREITTGIKKIPLGQAIMDHCSTTALSKEGSSTSYIDPKNFTSALIDKITYDPGNPLSIANDINRIVIDIEKTPVLGIELKRVFLSYANEAKENYKAISNKTVGEFELFKNKIETWFDSSMERVGGTMKRDYTRFWTFWLALAICLLLNADSISLAKYLYNNPDARIKLSGQAYKEASDSSWEKKLDKLQVKNQDDINNLDDLKNDITGKIAEIKSVRTELESSIPLGWNNKVFNDNEGAFNGWLILSKIIGLAATILAIMMGAPFWFDVLNKISNLRGTGTKPPTSAEIRKDNSPGTQSQPISLTVNTNKDEEAVG